MNRNVSILSVLVMMIVTVMATIAVAFATPNKGGSAQENVQGNGLEKVTICHKVTNTITVGAPAVNAHLENHGDTIGSCSLEGPVPGPGDGTTPELTTVATAEATLPNAQISDTATLSDATSDATGTITFSAYGPFTDADPTTDDCDETTLAYTSTARPIGSPDASGNYVVSSDDPAVETDDFAPTDAGRYQWVASYTSGDANNEDVLSVCNAEGEQSVVAEATIATATEQITTLALDHKEQRLLEIKEKLRADETPREQKEALRERRKELREELNG